MNVEVDTLSDRAHPLQQMQTRPGMRAREKRAVLYVASLLLDVLALVIGYIAAGFVRDSEWLSAGDISLLAIALPVFIMLEIAREVQSIESLEDRSIGTRRGLSALGATALVILGTLFLFDIDDFSRLGFIVVFSTATVVLIAGKYLLDMIFQRWMNGSAMSSILLIDGLEVDHRNIRHVVDVELCGLTPSLSEPARMDGLSRLIEPFDRVVVASKYERRGDWAMFLRSHDIGGEIILDRDLLHGAVSIGQYGEQDTLVLSRGPLSLANRVQKRAFDIVAAAIALTLLSPLLLLTALAIKLESRGPALFRQTRVGQGNRQFKIYKFRSMRVEQTDQAGNRSASRDDDRITKVGSFIRRTSIDELPQLLNVLLGHMSIVGPRPHALGSQAGDALFWEADRQYWLRHALKPGITGLAQVRGYRGATVKREDLEQRVRADLEYLASWSISSDIIIMLRTLRVVVHKNAY